MPTSPEYDAILARKIREREEGNKGRLDKNGNPIDPNAPKRLQYEASMIAMGAQEASQAIAPKRRGRPKGSKNKPKEQN